MQLLDNESFITQLKSLFEDTNQKGSSIWLTHKRLSYVEGENVASGPPQGHPDEKEYPCILKVTNGQKVKFSTHVAPGDLIRFHSIYGALLKNSMPSLRKRDKKREKERAERFALRKKKLTEDVIIEGPKRGAGRRKRQRRVIAAQKQEAARKKYEERQKEKQVPS